MHWRWRILFARSVRKKSPRLHAFLPSNYTVSGRSALCRGMQQRFIAFGPSSVYPLADSECTHSSAINSSSHQPSGGGPNADNFLRRLQFRRALLHFQLKKRYLHLAVLKCSCHGRRKRIQRAMSACLGERMQFIRITLFGCQCFLRHSLLFATRRA